MAHLVDLYFGQTVRCMRKGAGMTQEELAAKAGLQRNFISSLELGQKQPSLATVFKIAEALDVSADHLIRDIIEKIKTETSF